MQTRLSCYVKTSKGNDRPLGDGSEALIWSRAWYRGSYSWNMHTQSHTHTHHDHMHRIDSHFPGKPHLAGSSLNSQYPTILSLSIFVGQAKTLLSYPLFQSRQARRVIALCTLNTWLQQKFLSNQKSQNTEEKNGIQNTWYKHSKTAVKAYACIILYHNQIILQVFWY